MTTLYQTVNGTEVTTSGEPVGLVLDKSRFGEELITNGDFSNGTTGWTANDGDSADGVPTISVNGSGQLVIESQLDDYGGANQAINLTAGETYVLTFDVISCNKINEVRVGTSSIIGNGSSENIASSGSVDLGINSFTFVASSNANYLYIGGRNDVTSLVIDNVSVRQVDSVVLGSELVTNGTFDTDTSGWLGLDSASLSVSSGALRVTNVGNFYGKATQAIPTIAGNSYVITFETIGGTSPIKNFRAGTYALGVDVHPQQGITAIGSYEFIFTALTDTTYITFSMDNVDGNYIEIDNISVKEVKGTHAKQPTATSRPTFQASPNRLELDLVDDGLLVDIPTGGWDGYMVVGTDLGTASYGVSLPEGQYELGGDFFFGNSINQVLFKEGNVEQAHLKFVEQMFVNDGAKESYGDVTDFVAFWALKNITEFPLIDTSSGINFRFAWDDNNLTSFPLIDTSSGTSFGYAWRNNNLASFPLIDTSNGVDFTGAWRDNNLASFPQLDMSSATSVSFAWWNNNLTNFPAIDMSNCILFSDAWSYNSLTNFPQLDMSSAASVSNAWRGNNLTEFPAIDFPNCINFGASWHSNNLTSFPLINVSSGNLFSASWYNNNLTSFPKLDMSGATKVDNAWGYNNLTNFPAIDMPNCANFSYAWRNNPLEDFPANMFDNCLCINFTGAFLITNLSQTSIDNILVSIESNGTSNGTFDQSGGSAPSSIGESAIDNLRSRGWTITVTGGY